MNIVEKLMCIIMCVLIALSIYLIIQIIWWHIRHLDNKIILFIKKVIRKIQVFYVFKIMSRDEFLQWKYKRRVEIVNKINHNRYVFRNREMWIRSEKIKTLKNKYNNKFFKGRKKYERYSSSK